MSCTQEFSRIQCPILPHQRGKSSPLGSVTTSPCFYRIPLLSLHFSTSQWQSVPPHPPFWDPLSSDTPGEIWGTGCIQFPRSCLFPVAFEVPGDSPPFLTLYYAEQKALWVSFSLPRPQPHSQRRGGPLFKRKSSSLLSKNRSLTPGWIIWTS